MITGEAFAKMALSFAGTEQVPHFERVGFKITGRRMFSTYLEKDNTANVFLTPAEQAVFCKMDENIYLVPNKWGEKGATTIELDTVPKNIVMEALLSAYNEVMKPKVKVVKPAAVKAKAAKSKAARPKAAKPKPKKGSK